jgi:membrane protease subunit (stomatin/prohibitin family)
MTGLIVVLVVVGILVLVALGLAIHVVTQYEMGVQFRFGRVVGTKKPGLVIIIPIVDRLTKVTLRIITMPIQSQGIITKDNVSVDISAVAYFRVIDAVKSVVAIENVYAAIDQIAQTTLRKVVGKHTLDEMLAETDVINADIRKILDVTTLDWGVEVTLVELKDIQLPESMKRAMAKQAEAEREKRAKIIAAEGESLAAAALGDASDTMMAHPLALQLRRGQEHDRRLPRPAHEHHQRTRRIPGPRDRDCCGANGRCVNCGHPGSLSGRVKAPVPGGLSEDGNVWAPTTDQSVGRKPPETCSSFAASIPERFLEDDQQLTRYLSNNRSPVACSVIIG